MKSLRFLMTTTAGFAAFATSALAQMPTSGNMHSVSGHVRTRLEIVDNFGGNDTQWADRFLNRALLNIDVTPSDTLKVRISPLFTHTFGSLPVADTSTLAADLGTGEVTATGTTDGSDAQFTAYEAWMAWMPTDMWGVYVGRQALSYGNGLVIGTDDWFQTPRSFDAVRLVANMGMANVEAFYARLNERNGMTDDGIGTRNVDGNFYGLYANFKMEEMVQFVRDLDLYTFFWDDAQTGTEVADRNRIGIMGARVAGQMDMAFYDVEVTGQYGSTGGQSEKVKGIQADATIGANVMDRYMIGVNLAYANSQYTNLFGNTHEFLGDADMITRNNIMAMGIMADLGLTDMVSVEAAGHYFMKAKSDLDATVNGTAVTADKRGLGFEGDLALAFRPEEMLQFDFGYAFFKPVGAYKDSGADKVMSDIYLQGTLKF